MVDPAMTYGSAISIRAATEPRKNRAKTVSSCSVTTQISKMVSVSRVATCYGLPESFAVCLSDRFILG